MTSEEFNSLSIQKSNLTQFKHLNISKIDLIIKMLDFHKNIDMISSDEDFIPKEPNWKVLKKLKLSNFQDLNLRQYWS